MRIYCAQTHVIILDVACVLGCTAWGANCVEAVRVVFRLRAHAACIMEYLSLGSQRLRSEKTSRSSALELFS
jgi:hypothetical protein